VEQPHLPASSAPALVALNATQLTLPTPDRLLVWKKTQTGECRLCHHKTCTLFHILCNCPFSLNRKRYN